MVQGISYPTPFCFNGKRSNIDKQNNQTIFTGSIKLFTLRLLRYRKWLIYRIPHQQSYIINKRIEFTSTDK